MQKIIALLLATLVIYSATAQNSLTIVIKDSKTALPLSGASVSVKNSNIGNATDSNGTVVLTGLPVGKQTLVFSFTGYQTFSKDMSFPLDQPEIIIIELEAAEEEEMDEVEMKKRKMSETEAKVS